MKNGIIIFFYVDDIVLAYQKGKENEMKYLTDQLQQKYQLTGGNPLQWFLGIEVIRDRDKRLIWLSQSAYIDKIANLAIQNPDRWPNVPMSGPELLPYEERASIASIRKYQKKIGSILYAAVVTRPDIAFAVSRLARFNMNPSYEHHAAADKVIHYLKRTRSLALQLGGGDEFLVASDASFADNSVDRKSSQGYVMQLFGGTIGWRANKQDTVTTSTTEAELLALSQATKESIFISRLFEEIGIRLDNKTIRIQCDNRQTIKLVNKEVGPLQTKLRHVNIHDHWLRQETERRTISVNYVPTAEMVADGLTKALGSQPFNAFVERLGLVDIEYRLKQRKLEELDTEVLQKFEQLDLLVGGHGRLANCIGQPVGRVGWKDTLWVMDAFEAKREKLKNDLREARSGISISFDRWTSPKYLAILGVVAHFIDKNGERRSAVLGLRELMGEYSGENMAEVLLQIFKDYKISGRIG
ncbi:polyprotein [Pochonia chlamydosporia 170]|uniref:Polyprotein n=1 Tax=Pochonia chlamydosporia 170 TaxID=1380566 RepID=A0A179EVX4_METCM|nr:polyprotein [Pochonia chlamydosporia 170]OAQ57347.2 polyprotein [Pochonia chlamydosporia 170]